MTAATPGKPGSQSSAGVTAGVPGGAVAHPLVTPQADER